MHKKITLILLFAVTLCCCCSQRQRTTFSDKERKKYENYPLHLLALENKPIDDHKNLDLSLINESVFGRTPLQLLVEIQYQNDWLRSRRSVATFLNFIEHGADIDTLLDVESGVDIVLFCTVDFANEYLKTYLAVSKCGKLQDLSESGTNYLMGAMTYGNFESVPILLPHIQNINSTNRTNHTALHYAMLFPAPYKTIKLLLDNGADITMKDVNGRTPYNFYLYCHPEKYRSKTARLLREASGERY